MKFSLLVFRGDEAMGEYPFTAKNADASTELLTKLHPELAAVILGDSGIIRHTANLPKSNPWYRESLSKQ